MSDNSGATPHSDYEKDDPPIGDTNSAVIYSNQQHAELAPSEATPSIRRLPDHLVNQIAAGEVIERPASVVKELVENALDAKASVITITLASGGKSLIKVSDNGHGMGEDDLKSCIERHATSKLPHDDISAISCLGFRGEALPSIGSVARLTIASRCAHDQSEHGLAMIVENGVQTSFKPQAMHYGTIIDVRDLFFSVPARLKFLKGERAEITAVMDCVKRIAMARPDVQITLISDSKTKLSLRPQQGSHGALQRIADVIGADFVENAIPLEAVREDIALSGFAAIATYNRATSRDIYLFVNHRPVQDRLLLGAVRAAYRDVLTSGRFPVVVLFLDLDPGLVDVNVHPAKSEVRFRDAGHIRGLVVSSLKAALHQSGHQSASTGNDEAQRRIIANMDHYNQAMKNRLDQPDNTQKSHDFLKHSNDRDKTTPPYHSFREPSSQTSFLRPEKTHRDGSQNHFSEDSIANQSVDRRAAFGELSAKRMEDYSDKPLGVAVAQIHETYILAQNQNGLVVIDQHAAHERIVYEALKQSMAESGLARQILLIPEIIDLDSLALQALLDHADALEKLGLIIESFGEGSLMVREVPAIFDDTSIDALIKDMAEEFLHWDASTRLEERLHAIASSIACHGSIRAGRHMRPEEMDALLRQIETTPLSGQCNHGRPTWIELKRTDLESLFGRR